VSRLPRWALAAALLALPGGAPAAQPVAFGPDLAAAGWTALSFPSIAPTRFHPPDENTIEVVADGSAGLLWRRIEGALAKARSARWRWRADEGVAPTDLTRRGGDDRALALYFVFGAAADAGKAPFDLLRSSSVRALVYVFGGDKPRGVLVRSPHMGARGMFIVLRPADAARRVWFEEAADLEHDFRRAFGAGAPALLAVAIGSDSDDSRGRNRAQLRDLVLGD
jgi:hypothetical protein